MASMSTSAMPSPGGERQRVTRFAPSPTGELHLGNARTALFNLLLARGGGGRFLLRIEDTDSERSLEAHAAALMADLRWLGIDWDAGPDREDERGPYRQSQRGALYTQYLALLEGQGAVYPCFCTPLELELSRRAQLTAGRPPPGYGPVALIVGADGAPLSKRHAAVSVREYRERGYQPIALLNHLFRLGHSTALHGLLQLSEMARAFDTAHLGRAPSRFDEPQLRVWQKEAVHRLPAEAARGWLAPLLPAGLDERARDAFIAALLPNAAWPEDARPC